MLDGWSIIIFTLVAAEVKNIDAEVEEEVDAEVEVEAEAEAEAEEVVDNWDSPTL